jgi:hypothetical protein
MFKKTKKVAEVKPAPVETKPEPTEAEKIIAKGQRLKALSDEAAMWRAFATGCKGGRWLVEHIGYYGLRDVAPRLEVTMDDDSARLWAEFAIRMAEERERRLKDILG